MDDGVVEKLSPEDQEETRDWLESLDAVLQERGPDRVSRLIHDLQMHAHERGVRLPFSANTPYINTIPRAKEPPYPGNREIERRIKSIIRWNAMAMVVRANRLEDGIGGHISTYASVATLYEVAFNHFLRGRENGMPGDLVYFQGHASPGNYARSFLEGRLTREQLENFRRELRPGGGLTSYPHPRLMPGYWQFPTVSMGLGPIMAIYQARFARYLVDRGLKPADDQKIWAFLGDGETDEPETLGAISLAAREKLDNLIFVINCNLQRLDGPVRGNGKIIQELEAIFRGAGWNVIKVIWGDSWDPLLDRDHEGILMRRMNEVVDGQYQKYTVSSGAYIREHFFGVDPRLRKMVEHLSDEALERMRRGGHDPAKVYAAYKAAVDHKGSPTVILAKTIKGYGLGEAGEGRNVTHQQKKLNEDELRAFRTRFGIPISDEEVAKAPFYKPPEDSEEMRYLHERRKALGGYLPSRVIEVEPLKTPSEELLAEFDAGTEGRAVSTTMAYVRILAKLLRDPNIGRFIVPIVPDEARTFGMEALFRRHGIYSHVGQLYEPVDSDSLLYYKEVKDGQILEEGINEAGAISSFIAAGTAYANHGINTIPFFTYYSMFGFQRVGDLIWAAGDLMAKGFLVGATAGRTTLAGEGLQHQDGQSHVIAQAVPNLRAYDPAFAYELAILIRHGIKEMYEEQKDVFYYLTVYNENYPQPPRPSEDVTEGIIRGLYRFSRAPIDSEKRGHILAAGPIVNEAIKAQKLLAEEFGVAADVWSVTSYKALRLDGMETERHNMLHPEAPPRIPYVTRCLAEEEGVFVAASDYLRIIPDSISRWIPKPLLALGTDGYGRSEARSVLREYFEVSDRFLALGILHQLARDGTIPNSFVADAIKKLEIDPEKPNPLEA
ncbi:MAG: pyruvate dehydrogenase (acetyl-transferring), homodimeric type [Candidatus Hydrogenedentota bacterium]|nr:MAG: pyruvate dehydrogenase (acetyl-transferring), homodimeric type [Candidatus Hydrogenedentota bacterium]